MMNMRARMCGRGTGQYQLFSSVAIYLIFERQGLLVNMDLTKRLASQ